MNTPIIENLLPRLRETVATQMKNYLGGEGELSGIYESLEFWWDGIRDREFPELPMWDELPTPDRDRLFDEWIEAVEDWFYVRRVSSYTEVLSRDTRSGGVGKPGGPSNASGAGAPSAGTDVPRTLPWVDSTCCPACGCVGAHLCTGGQPSHPGWSAADQSLPVSSPPAASCASLAPLVPEVVKVAQEALESYQKALAALFMGPYTCAEPVAEGLLTAQGKGSKVIGDLRSYSPVPSPSVELLREAREALQGVHDLHGHLYSGERFVDKWGMARTKCYDVLSKLNAALD